MVTLNSGHPNANKNMDPRQHLVDKICTEVEGMGLSVPNPKNQHWSSATGHKGKSGIFFYDFQAYENNYAINKNSISF